MQERQVWSLGWEDPLENKMATYPLIAASAQDQVWQRQKREHNQNSCYKAHSFYSTLFTLLNCINFINKFSEFKSVY